MKANELRIGNIVGLDLKEFPDNYFEMYEVADKASLLTDLHGLDVHYFDADILEPIPLTDTWLIKFGFIDPAGNGMGYRIPVNTSDELCWYRQSNELRYQTKGSGFTRDFSIRYVHQLQNLYFALTGEELTLKP